MKQYKNKLILVIITFTVSFLIAKTVFSDWEHFKKGLYSELTISLK